jgi:ABC-type lipoprotein release transport system permease subunit
MGAVWLRARAQLRGRVGASLLLALLVGLAGGVVLAALAGARRSDAALPRFLAASRTTDTLVYVAGPRGRPGQPAQTDLGEELRAVAALPQVRAAQRLVPLIMSASDPTSPARPSRQLGWVGLDRPGNEGFGHPMVVAGRLPQPDRSEEAAVDEEFAWRHGLRPGVAFRVGTYTRAQFGPAGEGVPIPPEGPAADLRVTGILRFPDDLLPVAEGRNEVDADESSQLYLTPAFWRRYGPDLANYGITIAVDLHRGQADLPVFTAAVQRRFAGQAFVSAAEFDEEGNLALGVQRATALETAALLAFAALAALTAALLVGQTLGRQVLLESTEYPTLRVLGMTRGQLVAVALVRAAMIGVGGAALAVAAAVVLSPLTPIGVARRAELDPGVAADWLVLAVGGFAIVVLVAVGAALPAWRAAGVRGDALGGIDPTGSGRPSRVAAGLAAAGVPPTTVIGVRLALEPGRGRTAVPVRAALVGAMAAVCTVTAAAGFGASLTHLVSSPPAYGAAWDVAMGGFAPTAAAEPVAGQLLANPEVAAVAALFGQSEVTVNGRLVSILAIEERKGTLAPAVIEGREPLRRDEIALGSLTLRSLGRRVGDTVTLAAERRPARPLRVVGRVVLNQPGCDCVITQGKGGIVHPALFRDLAPDPELAYPSTFLVRLDPGVDRDRALARLRREFAGTMFSPRPHADIRNLQRVTDLPALLGALVVLVALGTVAHALVTSVRRRRRDLAVLKTLGLVRGQVAATIAWQATTFAVVALGLGLPLGIAVGRWAWQLTAVALGVASGPVVPLLAIVAAAVGMVLAVNLVAAFPGWVAGRLRPATVLRSE